MGQHCQSCNYTRYKLQELINQYQELLATKQQQIVCSHRIIGELQNQLREAQAALAINGHVTKQIQKSRNKINAQYHDTIQYFKQREKKLLGQLKNNEKQIFKLTINVQDNQEAIRQFDTKQKQNNNMKQFVTPKKNYAGYCNLANITLNKQRQNSNMIDRLFQQSTINLLPNSDCKDRLKLKVAEDQLGLMNIKYKMALLKTVEVATLR